MVVDPTMLFFQETFERAKAWVKELQRQASPNIVIALAGNKADLAEKRLVEYEVTHSCSFPPCREINYNAAYIISYWPFVTRWNFLQMRTKH